MKRYGPTAGVRTGYRRRWIVCEDIEKILVRIVEDNFLVLPGMNGSGFLRDFERWDRFGIAGKRPWVKFEVVVYRYDFFA